MREQMNRLVNEVFSRGGGEEGAWTAGAWTPPVEIYDTDDALMVRVELPGVAKEDVHVEVHEHTLSLRGGRKPDTNPPARDVGQPCCSCSSARSSAQWSRLGSGGSPVAIVLRFFRALRVVTLEARLVVGAQVGIEVRLHCPKPRAGKIRD